MIIPSLCRTWIAPFLTERNIEPCNIELSSAADHAQSPRFLTGLRPRFDTAPKATAPTICYVQPVPEEAPATLELRSCGDRVPDQRTYGGNFSAVTILLLS
jgi:hypothetical protein